MKVIGDIGIGIAFTTDANLDNLIAGVPTLLSIEAVAENTNRVLSYSVTSGSLPTGITLSQTGNLIGTVDLSEFTNLDANTITFDSNTTSFDRNYTFTITVSDQYQSAATSREFNVTVKLPYGVESVSYTHLTLPTICSV